MMTTVSRSPTILQIQQLVYHKQAIISLVRRLAVTIGLDPTCATTHGKLTELFAPFVRARSLMGERIHVSAVQGHFNTKCLISSLHFIGFLDRVSFASDWTFPWRLLRQPPPHLTLNLMEMSQDRTFTTRKLIYPSDYVVHRALARTQ